MSEQIEDLLKRYAATLTDTKSSVKKLEAVQLYRKANRHYESSKLLSQIGKDMGGLGLKAPHKLKKVYLVGALEIEKKKEQDLVSTK